MKFLVAVYSSNRQFVYDTDTMSVIDTSVQNIRWSEVINVLIKGRDIEYKYGCKYALREPARNIRQLLKQNFVMREVYTNKLIGYEVVYAKLQDSGSGVTWESRMVSIREAVEMHKRYSFTNVKLVQDNGKYRLIPKYDTFEKLRYDNTNNREKTEEKLSVTEKKIEKALDNYDAKDKKVVYLKEKVKRGFSNKAIAVAILSLLVTGAAVEAVKTPVLNNMADKKVVTTLNTSKDNKSAFDTAVSISLAKSVKCMDNKVFKDNTSIAYIDQDGINSICLKNNNGDSIIQYSKDRGMESKTNLMQGTTKVDIDYTMLGVASFKFSRNNSKVAVTSNKITVDGKEVYRVKNERGVLIIDKVENSSIDMTEAVTLLLGVRNWNEQLKLDNMKAE